MIALFSQIFPAYFYKAPTANSLLHLAGKVKLNIRVVGSFRI